MKKAASKKALPGEELLSIIKPKSRKLENLQTDLKQLAAEIDTINKIAKEKGEYEPKQVSD
jgi:hypothetical protein